MKVSPFSGKSAESSMLVNIPKLITAYYTEVFLDWPFFPAAPV